MACYSIFNWYFVSFWWHIYHVCNVFPSGASGKRVPANAGDLRDAGSILGSGTSLEEGMAIYSSILGWRIPWIEEPGGIQSIGSHRAGLS